MWFVFADRSRFDKLGFQGIIPEISWRKAGEKGEHSSPIDPYSPSKQWIFWLGLLVQAGFL